MQDQKETISKELLFSAAFDQREEERYQHSYDEELLQYEYLRDGDLRSIEESQRMFRTGITGQLSRDPLRNKKYLFVASVTLATRFAIEGGMSSSLAYRLSDLYIQRMDFCTDLQQVDTLQTEMFEDFTRRMAEIKRGSVSAIVDKQASRPVALCIDYIDLHLHSRITLSELGKALNFSPNHLNTVFRRETSLTLQQYIRKAKVEEAKRMLLYSHFSVSDISAYLAFSSHSHFDRIFKEETGVSPKDFQTQYYRHHKRWTEDGKR